MKLTGRKTVKGRTTSAPKTAKSTTAAPAAAVETEASAGTPKPTPTYEEIAIRSYELFLARGGEPGHAEDDWLAAERELSGSS